MAISVVILQEARHAKGESDRDVFYTGIKLPLLFFKLSEKFLFFTKSSYGIQFKHNTLGRKNIFLYRSFLLGQQLNMARESDEKTRCSTLGCCCQGEREREREEVILVGPCSWWCWCTFHMHRDGKLQGTGPFYSSFFVLLQSFWSSSWSIIQKQPVFLHLDASAR